MDRSLLLFLLSLTVILPLSSALLPSLHLSKTHLHQDHHRKPSLAPPQEYIEVSRPLPFDSLTPSCTLPLLSHTFSNTSDHHPATANYSTPANCSWSNAVLHFSAASNGSRRGGRVGAVWLSAVELLRTTTPEPTSNGTFWSFRKDVTRYASLLRRSNLTLSLILQNLTHHAHTENYHINITFLYYDVNATNDAVDSPLSLLRSDQKPEQSLVSLKLDENPADLIIPVNGDKDLWFKIEQESDALLQKIKIPPNTYRAVIEIHVSSHDQDEFWYANPPDYYLETNNLPMQRGHGSYREILVKIDDNVVGTVVPFPVISNGGIDPLFWEPLVSIGAFDLPSYELELTPFLGLLLDQNNNQHFLKLEMADALSFWLVDANLHLWLDSNGSKVEAGPIRYEDPSICLERESKFHQLDGKFTVEGERKSEVSGWVSSGTGNFTTHVYSKQEFESKVVIKHNGTKWTVKQEVKVVEKVKVKSDSGHPIAGVSRERRYPLQLTATAMPGSEDNTFLISAELEHSLKEERKEKGGSRSKSENRQKCRGWMFVRGCQILSGAATTAQTYHVKDGYGCYTRRAVAEGGTIRNDTHSALCATAAAY